MVLIDGTKYACQSCIKGHRSSKCTHTARPLTEIKKKGRPTSQCTHCRQLRKTKSVHGRCDCAARDVEQKASPRLLPNGLVDAVATPEPEDGSSLTTTEPSGVTRLLNPCSCLRGGKCTCCSVVKRSAPKPFPSGEPDGAPVASTSSGAGASGGCCSSSSRPDDVNYFDEPAPPARRPPIDFSHDIPVSTPSPPSPSASHLAAPSPSPSFLAATTTPADALFLLPATHGTHACFCGPTCACVGCAVHDPHSRKRPRAGACGGGGCRCGTGKGCEQGGKRARVVGEERGGGGGGCCGEKKDETPRKSCCGSGGAMAQAPMPMSGIELPSLWAHGGALSASLSSAGALPTSTSPAPPSAPGTVTPLPSLRTLYPALLDLELGTVTATSSSSSLTPAPAPAPPTPDTSFERAAAAALALELGLAPPGERAQKEEDEAAPERRADCSAVWLTEPLDDACGLRETEGAAADEGCHCSSACGCRGGADAGGREMEVQQQHQHQQREADMRRVAQLAALGAFG